MEQRDRMRAADSDREAVAERLRQALNEGRLDIVEYDERLRRAYGAKTYGDLDGLLDDLPPSSATELVPVANGTIAPRREWLPGPDGRYPGATRRWLVDTWEGYLGTVGVLAGIWAVTCLMSSELVYFWPGWVAAPWGAVLVVGTVTGLAKGEPQRWAARRAAGEQAKIKKRRRQKSERAEPDGVG